MPTCVTGIFYSAIKHVFTFCIFQAISNQISLSISIHFKRKGTLSKMI